MHKVLKALAAACTGLLLLSQAAFAQLPTPTYGWNLGNTLEPPTGEGTWGPAATQNLINAVANAGFNTVRLPVAWDSHANQSTYQIDAAWMARVKQVVDWCYARNLYVVINCHWDNGWLENNITDSVNPTINAKMQSYWTQIATTFRNYDAKLIFAGANEPNCDTAAEWNTLRAYYQTFINAVRATGGNNSTRWLALSGPSTDIDLTDTLMNTLPTDSATGRLMVEVHYYSPYQYCLMTADADWGKMFYFWGAGYRHPTRTDRNPTWGEEDYLTAQFEKMRVKFISRGIPVILGEFQSFKRTGQSDLTGADFNLHVAARTYFHKKVVDTANSKGLKPIYWDIAGQMFDWTTGAITDNDNKNVLVGGAALPPPSSTPTLTVSNSSLAFGAAAGSSTFSVNSNVSWTTTDNQSWITVSPASGSNNAAVTVTVTANTSTTARSGTVTVTGSGITRTVAISQSGASSTNLTVSVTSLSFGAAAGSNTFGITSNVAWTTTDNQTWITVTPASGSNNATATVTVTANTGTAARSGTVTVTGSGITRTITVNQSGTASTADTYQAESGTIAGGVTIDSNNAGFNGTGFANFPANGGSLTFNNVDGNGGGTKAMQIRYALGATSSRTGTLVVNGTTVNITFAPTGSWTTWNTLTVNITLNNNSTNSIRFNSTGGDLGNIDQILIP